MSGILLTANQVPVFGTICYLLGKLIEGIFTLLDKIGIPNVGLAIILFTIVIYTCLTPLTYSQQKFSKLSAKMQPELKKIQDKYKGRRDNDSMLAMQEETKKVYAKYGVSPTGSCLQMGVQLPILFALYQVIYKMPAYVAQIKAAFFPLTDNLIAQTGSAEFVQTFDAAKYFTKQFSNEAFTSGTTEYVQNTFIDVLNRASTSEWLSIAEKYPTLASDVVSSMEKLTRYNSFIGGINISDSPWYTIKNAFSAGAYGLVIIAVLIPLLSAFTQWVNVKLMPQPASGGDPTQDSMMQSMKTMNVTMPLFSAFFCLQLPAGMGIYWIASAVVRSVQQIIINKHIDKIDFDAEIKKNEAKAIEKNKGKDAVNARTVNNYATLNTRKSNRQKASAKARMSDAEWERLLQEKEAAYANAKPGSITAKANLVKRYNESNQA